MLAYDPAHPLICIHIPKTAGTSVHELFKQWFGDGLLTHYYREASCEMPDRHDIFDLHRPQRPIAVYGHFNRRRHFGVEDYYPQAKQFITIMRDPLERLVSHYYYIQKVAQGWKKHTEPLDPDLLNYVRTTPSVMLNYFPRVITFDNYRDIIEQYFIEIGIMENLNGSLQSIAHKLNKPFSPSALEHLNATERSETVPDAVRDQFIENNALEYTVYHYAKDRLTRQLGEPRQAT